MPATAPLPTARRDQAEPPLLQVERLSVQFGQQHVLRDISIDIPAGQTLVVLGENPLHCGLSEIDLSKLTSLVTLDILPNESLKFSKVVLPGSASAEKRGSMVNINGRLQRLNRALTAPGHARDDWEILSDLLKGLGAEGASSLEELFKQMAATTPALSGLNFGKIGDLGVTLKA